MTEREYQVTWIKNYYLMGNEKIVASSREEAEKKMRDKIGDMGLDDGKLEYDETADYVEVGNGS